MGEAGVMFTLVEKSLGRLIATKECPSESLLPMGGEHLSYPSFSSLPKKEETVKQVTSLKYVESMKYMEPINVKRE